MCVCVCVCVLFLHGHVLSLLLLFNCVWSKRVLLPKEQHALPCLLRLASMMSVSFSNKSNASNLHRLRRVSLTSTGERKLRPKSFPSGATLYCHSHRDERPVHTHLYGFCIPWERTLNQKSFYFAITLLFCLKWCRVMLKLVDNYSLAYLVLQGCLRRQSTSISPPIGILINCRTPHEFVCLFVFVFLPSFLLQWIVLVHDMINDALVQIGSSYLYPISLSVWMRMVLDLLKKDLVFVTQHVCGPLWSLLLLFRSVVWGESSVWDHCGAQTLFGTFDLAVGSLPEHRWPWS